MLRRVLKLLLVLLAIVGLATIAVVIWFASSGISARAEPGGLERTLARALRSAAIPDEAKRRTNPVPLTEEVKEAGLAHFADHCAVCHGNDGRGDTTFGRGMYPSPPDLRMAPTQDLTDGAIFYIIEKGVKLTGMPAFGDGTPESAAESWELVHFIRRVPNLTGEEIKRMEMLNPRSPEEWRQMDQQKSTPGPKPHIHKHGGH